MSSTFMGSHVVFAGGHGQGNEVYHCSVDTIKSKTLQWERLADAPLEYSSIITLNGVLLAIGGRTGSSGSAAMFGFSVHTRSWHHFFDLPLPLSSTSTAVIQTGQIVAIGGRTDSSWSSRVFRLYIKNEAALGLSNIILKGVQSGLLALVERALTVVKEHSHSSQQDGSLLLDFLAHSSSPNVSSIECSCSPLMIACDNEDTKMVDVLLENGASTSYKNKDDVTALHVACSKDNLKLVQRLVNIDSRLTEQAINLLQMTDKEGQTVFHYACGSHFGRDTLKWLLKNQTLRDMLNKRTNTGYTPLLTACHNANVAAVEVLVTHDRVDTTLRDDNNQGALHLAAMHDSSSIVELLLDKGCPSDTQDSEGNTALHFAYKKSSSSVITVLTRVDDGRIELIMNKAGQRPADIEPDDIIPPEIKKKGTKAVDLYLEALMEGKTKIPRCNLVSLGEERVGKTSLYRLLVRKGFDPNQDSTRGIDNTIVEALDRRNVMAEDWSEKDDQMVEDHAEQQFASGVVEAMPSDLLTQSESHTQSKGVTQTVTESELYEELSKLELSLNQQHAAAPPPARKSKLKHFFQQKRNKDVPDVPKSQAQHEANVPSPHLPSSQPEGEQPRLKDVAESMDQDSPRGFKSKLKRLFKPGKKQSHQTQPIQPEVQTISDDPVAPTLLDENDNPETRAEHHNTTLSSSPPPVANDEEPSQSSESAPSAESAGKLSGRQTRLINEKLVKGASKKKVDPVLHLNVLDFAGQKQYRPMHHCFLTRRAMYLVVFNLQHVIQYLEQKKCSDAVTVNPFEEIRYWLHSIHVHTLPAVPGKEKKALKNVCLVGTHRNPPVPSKGRAIDDEELQKINDLITKEIVDDDRCISHLHFMGPDHKRVFIAVENSIDGKEEEHREASGAKALQDEIKKVTNHLSFIEEDYPLSWLRLEAKLVERRKKLEGENSSLLIQLDQVLRLATQCGIRSPEGQNLALEFFHETGKIVYLKLLPRLFISEAQHAELADLVVLDPTWLIRVMQNVVELDYRSSIEGPLIRQLHNTGVASSALLKEAWSGYLREPIEQSFHQFCLMLQAECLIHPITFIPESAVESESQALPTTIEAASTDEEQLYLVPGKLPDNTKEEPAACSKWVSFYFDFKKFLPNELYHRLICLLLAEFQRNKSLDKPYLSKTICRFYNIDECHWSIEFERAQHRLKISVLSSDTDKRSPSHHIDTIHTEYIRKICTLSNLKGLRYVGGPLLDPCHNIKEKCKETNVIRYVHYFEGEDQSSESRCPMCLKTYDVNQLLTNQVNDRSDIGDTDAVGLAPLNIDDTPSLQPVPPLTHDPNVVQKPLCVLTDKSATAMKVTKSSTSPPPHGPKTTEEHTQPSLLVEQPTVDIKYTESSTQALTRGTGITTAQMQAVAQSAQSSEKFSSLPPPDLRNLTNIKWRNDKGDRKKCSVIDSICPKWHKLGILLGMRGSTLSAISMKNRENPEQCCNDVIIKWLEDGSPHYPLTWKGVFELLDDLDETEFISELQTALLSQT